MNQNVAASWYVLQVAPGLEFRIAGELRRLGHTYLVPFVERRTRTDHAGRRSARDKRRYPLFPKYVFVGVSGTPEWAKIKALKPGPVRPVQFDDSGPARLSAAEVAYLATVKDIPVTNTEAIREGVLARIATGPLEGLLSTVRKLRGEFAEIDGKLGKIRVRKDQLAAA